MKIAIGSDMTMHVTQVVITELKKQGHEVQCFGALKTEKEEPWPKVGFEVGEAVASGEADQGILFCWTGTGVSIAANKVKGIRAALCTDAQTAEGARKWNDANILVMSLRLTSEVIAKEILDAWFNTLHSEEESDKSCFRILDEKERLGSRK
ncbi:MAG: RpiB/LacA/LacB family sugar-phosphate isomerase [Bacteroidetes bacterium]|jgi:ribose 5-phosphate isomerase B|nr:RpiB/LacA/LacB family sugar-phosphate isomerase [Bacteroidota bacterium]MDF1868096.1 RpiB/LacA/LacB family sugar-phosphate isomerase [Saprospiraceae bacterium]